MGDLELSFACWCYDRVRPVVDGRVKPDGLSLIYHDLRVEETFFRQLRYQEFDVAEMSLCSYVMTHFWSGGSPFVAIPVFPSRYFRHGSIYVNADAGIGCPADLAGGRVGTAEFQMTAGVWERGILAEHYGLPVDAVTYYTGGLEQPGRVEKTPLRVAPSIHVERIPPGRTLSDMLLGGELEAIYAAQGPMAYEEGDRRVRRLFSDYAGEERTYFEKTGVFPIMHTVVVKRDLYRRHPWVARSMMKALTAARDIAYDELYTTAALKYMLPWANHHVEETRRLMGGDFWPYGVEPNRVVVETFLRYAAEQGLIPDRPAVEELFASETVEEYRI